MKDEKKIIEDMLKKAGITINGSNDYDIQVHNENVYRRILQQGSLGLGESYMDGWWDCVRLDEFFRRVLMTSLRDFIRDYYICTREEKNMRKPAVAER